MKSMAEAVGALENACKHKDLLRAVQLLHAIR